MCVPRREVSTSRWECIAPRWNILYIIRRQNGRRQIEIKTKKPLSNANSNIFFFNFISNINNNLFIFYLYFIYYIYFIIFYYYYSLNRNKSLNLIYLEKRGKKNGTKFSNIIIISKIFLFTLLTSLFYPMFTQLLESSFVRLHLLPAGFKKKKWR